MLVALGIAFGFVAGVFFALTLAVISDEPWPGDVGRLIDGWREHVGDVIDGLRGRCM